MKSKFHIIMVDDGDPYIPDVPTYVQGNREFETREEAESVLISIRKASEAAGFKTRYILGECLYLES